MEKPNKEYGYGDLARDVYIILYYAADGCLGLVQEGIDYAVWWAYNWEWEVYYFYQDWFFFTSPHYIFSAATPAFLICAGLFGIDLAAKHYNLYDFSTWDSWFSKWLPTWLYKPQGYRSPEHKEILIRWHRWQVKRDASELGKRRDKIAEIKRLEKEIAELKARSSGESYNELAQLHIKAHESYLIAVFDHHPVFLFGGLFCAWFIINNGLKFFYGPNAGLQAADYVTGHLHALGRWLIRNISNPPIFVGINPADISLTRIAEDPKSYTQENPDPTITGSDGQEWLGLSDHPDIPTSTVLTPDFTTWRIKSWRMKKRRRSVASKRKRLNFTRTRLTTWPEMDPLVETYTEIEDLYSRSLKLPRHVYMPIRFPYGGRRYLPGFVELRPEPDLITWRDYPWGYPRRKVHPDAQKYANCTTWVWDSELRMSIPDPWGRYKPTPASSGLYAANTIIWALGLGLNIYFYYNELLHPLLTYIFSL